MGRNIKDITSQRFSYLVAIRAIEDTGKRRWECVCDCGNVKIVCISNLMNNNTKSCGCLRKKQCIKRKTHGYAGKSEYTTWGGIIQRCCNENHPQYANYGGRGIKICDRWRNSFEDYLSDVGLKPTPRHSLDRIDNDGDYEPSNFRWATSKEQAANKRNSTKLEYNGEILNMKELAKRFGVSRAAISKQLKYHNNNIEKVINHYVPNMKKISMLYNRYWK